MFASGMLKREHMLTFNEIAITPELKRQLEYKVVYHKPDYSHLPPKERVALGTDICRRRKKIKENGILIPFAKFDVLDEIHYVSQGKTNPWLINIDDPRMWLMAISIFADHPLMIKSFSDINVLTRTCPIWTERY